MHHGFLQISAIAKEIAENPETGAKGTADQPRCDVRKSPAAHCFLLVDRGTDLASHRLRRIRQLADQALDRLNRTF